MPQSSQQLMRSTCADLQPQGCHPEDEVEDAYCIDAAGVLPWPQAFLHQITCALCKPSIAPDEFEATKTAGCEVPITCQSTGALLHG